ncbi:MAG: ABC transporter [Azorhizobium sp. 32-67-21]|nr:MAG: ABC transporter [Azorhizobium sp. 32-67-21]
MAAAASPDSEMAPALALVGVGRRYTQGEGHIEVLRNADFVIEHGQSVALVAPSGSGKSTLLHLAGLLEHPDDGEVYIDGRATSKLSDAERTRIRRARAGDLLSYLGLGHRLTHRPAELSGGEQQRVAIARALANAPRLLLADEPTGNLDPRTSAHVFGALTELVHATGVAALIATHNLDLAAQMDRRVTLRDGAIVELA